jgi:putative Mg2+ transporter-C (MgtC) family protein
MENLLTGNVWNQLYLLGDLIIAMLLATVIGIEREWSDKPAGLRTHVLVSGAAALFVGLANLMVLQFNVNRSVINTDPIRVIEAVVAGVSFLGAGTIFRRGDGPGVEGLTTAASLLFSAGVGVCVGSGQIVLAVGTTLLALATLLSGRLLPKYRET